MPMTHHGGRTDVAARLFPDAPTPWLDLSTGINPVPWDRYDPALIDMRALPTPTALDTLERAAARFFGYSGAVAAIPGSEIGLRLLATLALPLPVRRVTPSYRTYGEALPASTPIAVEDIAAACEAGGTLVVANPNNPDGRVIPPQRLLEAARRLARAGGLLVVDEAFADLDPATSVLPHLRQDDSVLVFRSFGKFFGLAGVRLGFACGKAQAVGSMRDRLGSWPVSGAAIQIGTSAYQDFAWIEQARASIRVSSAALDQVLLTHGLKPVGDCPLFRVVEGSATLFEKLARAGILVRPFDYAPNWLRFGLPPDEQALGRLARALASG